MSNFEILVESMNIQGAMSNHIEDIRSAYMTWNDIDETGFWNYALTNKILSEKEISVIEEKFALIKRKPAIYFEDREDLNPLKETLIKRGYKELAHDAWMFYEGGKIKDRDFFLIKVVESENDLRLWLETIDHAFAPDDPANLYGGLGKYLIVMENVWKKYRETGRFEYLYVEKNGKPVAVACVDFGKMGYISGVGSLREVRGEGYGKLVTLSCIQKAQARGLDEIFLGTEVDGPAYHFYEKLGFRTRVRGFCYTL